MSQIQLLFYSPNLPQKTPSGRRQHIPSSYFVLKNYIKEKDLDLFGTIDWHMPFVAVESIHNVLLYIEEHNITCLCVGLYIWNYKHCCFLAEEVKKRFQNKVKIVAGGPSCNSELDSTWAVTHPYFDYSVAGDGEQPFLQVLKSVVGIKKLNPVSTKNIVYRDNEQIIKTAYQYNKPDSITSPYIELNEELAQLCKKIQDNIMPVIITYETSRGCPYACTFCDWTSGLSHKVSKRPAPWTQELDAIMDAGIDAIYIGDANYGQWDADVELAKYMGHLAKTRGLTIGAHNMSKNKKANVEKIFEIMAENDLIEYFKFSVQDPDPTVLGAIDRPDITWEEHMAMKDRLETKFPHVWSEVELILGLPGQTKQGWEDSIRKVIEAGCFPRVMVFEILPQSPAGYNQEYRTKWAIHHKVIWYPWLFEFDDTAYDYSLISRPTDTVLSTSTFSMLDHAHMIVWYYFIQAVLDKIDLFGFMFSCKQQREVWPLIVKFLDSIGYRDQVAELSKNLVNNFNRDRPVFALSIPKNDSTAALIRPNFHIDSIVEENKHIFLDLLQSCGMYEQYTLYQSQPKKGRGLIL
jgi:putative methyltransferase